MKKNATFEQAMSRLEEIVAQLDSGMLELEQSLKLYSEGAELLAFCNRRLEEARLTVEKVLPQPQAEEENEHAGR